MPEDQDKKEDMTAEELWAETKKTLSQQGVKVSGNDDEDVLRALLDLLESRGVGVASSMRSRTHGMIARQQIIASAAREYDGGQGAQITDRIAWINGALKEASKAPLTQDEQKTLAVA